MRQEKTVTRQKTKTQIVDSCLIGLPDDEY